jgi:hypothetical protein
VNIALSNISIPISFVSVLKPDGTNLVFNNRGRPWPERRSQPRRRQTALHHRDRRRKEPPRVQMTLASPSGSDPEGP